LSPALRAAPEPLTNSALECCREAAFLVEGAEKKTGLTLLRADHVTIIPASKAKGKRRADCWAIWPITSQKTSALPDPHRWIGQVMKFCLAISTSSEV
jgi:hypothetical protein